LNNYGPIQSYKKMYLPGETKHYEDIDSMRPNPHFQWGQRTNENVHWPPLQLGQCCNTPGNYKETPTEIGRKLAASFSAFSTPEFEQKNFGYETKKDGRHTLHRTFRHLSESINAKSLKEDSHLW